jgi:hypothetical protein
LTKICSAPPTRGGIVPHHPGDNHDDDDDAWEPSAALGGMAIVDDDDGTYATCEEFESPLTTALREGGGITLYSNTIQNLFLLSRWMDRSLNHRISLKVFLPSFPFKFYTITISKGGLSVIVKIRIPTEVLDVERLNNDLYRNENKSAKYGIDHFKTIADKNTVKALRQNDPDPEARVYLQQIIPLPLKCHEEFVELDGLKGLRFKLIQKDLKVAVCELIGADAVSNGFGKKEEEEEDADYEEVTYHDGMSTTSTYRPGMGAASVVSINPENGKLRKKLIGYVPSIPVEVTATPDTMDLVDLFESSWYAGMKAEGKLEGLDLNNVEHTQKLREMYKQYKHATTKRRRNNFGTASVGGTVMSCSATTARAVAAATAKAQALAAEVAQAAAMAQGVKMAQNAETREGTPDTPEKDSDDLTMG